MKEIKRFAYLRILYYALLEIRSLSYMHNYNLFKPWTWLRSIRKVERINKISDALHNLPILIEDDRFDEELFWRDLSLILPDRVEYLREEYEETLNAYFPININYLEPWQEVRDGNGTKFEREFMKEIRNRHPLYYCKIYTLARRIDNDDVLFRILGDHDFFVVAHLTWNDSQPRIREFESIKDWEEACMIKDNKEYSDSKL
jgi:hypothetical protein